MRKFHINSDCEYSMFLSPDTIWSENALKIIIEDMEKTYKASFIHYRRSDISLLKYENISYPINTYDLFKLSKKYTHRLHYAHNLNSANSTMWPEYYYDDNDDNEINYIINKEPLYLYKDIALDHHNHITYIPENNIKIYGGTSNIFCISLAKNDKYDDWIDLNSRLTENKISSWARKNCKTSSLENFRGKPIVWKESESKLLNVNIVNQLQKYDQNLYIMILLDELMFYLLNIKIEDSFDFIQNLKKQNNISKLNSYSIICIIYNRANKKFSYEIYDSHVHPKLFGTISFGNKLYLKLQNIN